MPYAATAITATCCMMFMKLLKARKRGFSTAKTTQSTASEMMMPPYWRTSGELKSERRTSASTAFF